MKTALCLYGQPRTMEYCAPSLKAHILDIYAPDIFICSDSQGDRMKSLYRPVDIRIISDGEIAKITAPRRKKYGESFTNPGPYKEYPIWTISDLSVMYKAYNCKQMLQKKQQEGSSYDIVIGTRFDAKFLNIQHIEPPEKNTLYIPKVDAFGKAADENGIHWGIGYCAHIWWSTPEVAENFLDSYTWSDEYYDKTGRWCGEDLVKWFCDTNNISVKYTDVTFMLIRGDNSHPREGLPPWRELSLSVFPEYLSGPVQRRLEAEKLKNEERKRRYKK